MVIGERRRPLARARTHIHLPRNIGEAAADRIARGMGSWIFIIAQTGAILVWVALNVIGLFALRWDPYPFILLNLLFSTQAAYAAPIIMMSQNRQAQKDRLRDDHEAEEVSLLYQINQRQLAILDLLHRRLVTDVDAGQGGIAANGSGAVRAAGTATTTVLVNGTRRRRR